MGPSAPESSCSRICRDPVPDLLTAIPGLPAHIVSVERGHSIKIAPHQAIKEPAVKDWIDFAHLGRRDPVRQAAACQQHDALVACPRLDRATDHGAQRGTALKRWERRCAGVHE